MARRLTDLIVVGICLAAVATVALAQTDDEQLQQLQAENASLREELRIAAEENAALQAQVTALGRELADARADYIDVADSLWDVDVLLTKCEEELSSLRQQVAEDQGTPPLESSEEDMDAGTDEAVHRSLQKDIGALELDEIELVFVLEYVRDVADMNMHVRWYALEAVGISRDTLVNVQLREVTWERALRVILEDAGSGKKAAIGDHALSYEVEGGVLTISTGDDLRNAKCVPVIADGDDDSQAHRAVLERLERIETPEFYAMTFEDVLDYLQAVGEINIHTRWDVLRTVGIDKTTEVNLADMEATIGKFLRIILEDLGQGSPLCYIIDEGVITISTSEDLQDD